KAEMPHLEPTKVDADVVVEMFDFYWRQGSIREARELLEKTAEEASQQSWWKARKLILEKSAKEFLGIEEATKARFDDSTKKSAAQKWGDMLDEYIGDSRPRKALNEIARTITPERELEWGIVAWERLPRIWNALGLIGFEWRSGQGIQNMHRKLSIRPRPRLSRIAGQPYIPSESNGRMRKAD